MEISATVGNTPLVKLKKLPENFGIDPSNSILAKLEGNNPAGSVKDRPALAMISNAEARGDIKVGDRLIEATSGNTGIALAMIAAAKDYKMTLIMPANATKERKASMLAYGAELILVSAEGGMEEARDLALAMQQKGEGIVLDQFANNDNWQAHFDTTAPEIWNDTAGKITHFVSSMGTTGTIMGVSRFLKQQNQNVEIIGLQPDANSAIPGIRRWSKSYLPKIYQKHRVDTIIDISQQDSEQTMRDLAKYEGLSCGVSSGGAIFAALNIAKPIKNSVIVAIICDRGDRYLSSFEF